MSDASRSRISPISAIAYSTPPMPSPALEIFTERSAIDLLLTDVVLPGRLRGRDLADLVRRASPRTKILFMSGYTENAIVHDGKLDEGTLLLSKPFRREDLAKKVALALNIEAEPVHAANVVRLPSH